MTSITRRRAAPAASLLLAPLLLAPLLLAPMMLSACSSSAPLGASSAEPSAASAAPASAAAAGGADLYKKYTSGAQFCGVVPLSAVSAAMHADPAYSTVKVTASPAECTYADGSVSSIVTVEWSPVGGGLLDADMAADKTVKPTVIDVGGRPGRSADGDVQIVVGDAAIDVFGVGKSDTAKRAAVAAAFAARV